MVLHGGQANLTKDEYSQMSQFMSSRPWSQFGTGASCVGSGSGSVVVVALLPLHQLWLLHSQHCQKRFVMLLWNWAGQVLPGATGQRLPKTGCQNFWQERPKNQLYFDGCPHWAFKDRMHASGYFIEALMLYNISSKHSIRFDFAFIEFNNLDLFKQ